jgi:hypothetical protein
MFLERCQVFQTSQSLSTEFPESLRQLTTLFDIFSRQVVAHFSTVRRGASARVFRPASPIFQSAGAFMIKWQSLIEIVNKIADYGFGPYRSAIDSAFSGLSRAMAFIVLKMRSNGAVSREVLNFVQKARKIQAKIQEELMDIVLISEEAIEVEVNRDNDITYFRAFVSDMNAILNGALSPDVLSHVENAKLRIDISVGCSSLTQIVQSMKVFHSQVSGIKTAIVDLNVHLAELHVRLNLPFAMVLTVEEKAVDFPSGGGDDD